MTTANLAQALVQGKFLINLNNLVSSPARTGIQRVCYEFCTRWPFIKDTIPFVELGMDKIGVLGPEIFESLRLLFEGRDDTLESLSETFDDMAIDPSPGLIGIVSARNRIICELPVTEALDCCRAVISLEESLNQEFFNLAAATQPEKIFNLCHDFLSWTHSEFFGIDWRHADNIATSLANRRKYTHNIFTSTATRDIFVNRINRGDRRPYRVVAPGADGLGRTFRKNVPDSSEFLVIGTLEPRKQPLHILSAFERLQSQGYDTKLCFAGKMGWLEPADKTALLEAFKRHSWVRWVDSPSDAKLRNLMMNCRATVYMSVAEGFGSPPVESLALGIPCIVTEDLPSILDLAPNGQVRLKADDGEALSQAVRRLLDDQALLALQAEIETLELPTWQSFVDGIAELIAEKVPLGGVQDIPSTSYQDRLNILASLTLMRQLGRAELVEHLVLAARPNGGEREVMRWQIKAERSAWSNIEVVLNLLAAFPDALPASLVGDAVAGKLKTTGYVPATFAKQWRTRFRQLMSISPFPAYFGAIYADLHARDLGEEEAAKRLPYDERVKLRTSYLRDAIESKEYKDRLVSHIRHSSPDEYFDFIDPVVIAWKQRVLDQLTPEAATERALLIDDDEDFLKAATLDLTGQLPSRDALAGHQAVLRTPNGREQVLLRILLSELCLRRVKDPDTHLELISKLARRAKITRPRPIAKHAIPGMVNRFLALDGPELSKGFTSFFGRDPAPAELALTYDSSRPVSAPLPLAARLVLYATLRGDIAMSPPFLAWSAGILAQSPMTQGDRDTFRIDRVDSAERLFTEKFGRNPEGAEVAILADINAQQMIDAVCVAAIRAGYVKDIASELAYFAQKHERLTADFERIDDWAERLLVAEPVQSPVAWTRPLPVIGEAGQLPSADAEFSVHRHAEDEIITVDQLMALDGRDFVCEAYRKLLCREADEAGLQTYLGSLQAGRSKAAIIYSLRTGGEGKSVDANMIGLNDLLARQRLLRRWFVRKPLELVGIKL